MAENYTDYKENVIDDLETCLDSLGCQPILFIGSGFTRRYISGPNWEELLQIMVEMCPNINHQYAYYKQSYKDPISIGSEFVEPFKEWAWSTSDGTFPEELFSERFDSDVYLKYKVSEYFDMITPSDISEIDNGKWVEEINSLKAINPHAIITTNFDKLIETIFNDYTPVIGQKILKSNTFSVGEIFKIHGCTSKPDSLVLTKKDYDNFIQKKKYLSAKLLTFFAEHPLIFIGYSASDPNIQTILSDIDEIISVDSDLIPNIYVLQWKEKISESEYPQREQSILLNDKRSIRIKCIIANSFDWVFKTLSHHKPIESVHPKVLRALLARTYDLVRCDIPRKIVEVDFDLLEHALSTGDDVCKIYGITSIGDSTKVNAQFPYTLTSVAKQLGYSSWHYANQLLDIIKRESGRDIKSTDNIYHIAIKVGDSTKTHKYSQEMVNILEKVRDKEWYELKG